MVYYHSQDIDIATIHQYSHLPTYLNSLVCVLGSTGQYHLCRWLHPQDTE
jgi:hypothetical protein